MSKKEKVRLWIKINWKVIPLLLALSLLGLFLWYGNEDFANLATYALVALTAIYVYGTMKIVDEMKQSRLDTVKPSLSLKPERFLSSDSFAELYLNNSGGLARNIKIDIKVTGDKGVNENHSFYIASIDRNGKVSLPISNIFKLQEANCLIKIQVNYKDSYNQILEESLELDFSEINKEKRQIIGEHEERIV
ncbi:MAG: hypothetical protein ABIB93_01060 [Chloroflexota bacterium]